MILHRAPFIVPVSSPPIVDGGVLVDQGRIQAVGRFVDLRPGASIIEEHPESILTPPLVNCHCHLELAHLAELGHGSGPENFTSWVKELVETRFEKDGDGYPAAGRKQLEEQEASGVGLLADIGNLADSEAIGSEGLTKVVFLQEMLGLSQDAAENVIKIIDIDDSKNFTAHAPYSTAAILLKTLKTRARQRNSLFSIHVAESPDEMRFMADGSGPLRDFIEEKGGWDNSFAVPGCGSIEYLDRLGILDNKTLCVHCVHVTDEEISLIAGQKARVCLCPGSNDFLGVGRAPLARFIKQGILPGLGTDSRASNPLGNIWEEMRVLAGQQPEVEPSQIFAMATMGGARALGYKQYGVLEKGAGAAMLAVSYKNGSGAELFDFLINIGKHNRLKWMR